MHLEKGQYLENCRGMTEARDGYISSIFNEENGWEFLLNIVYF
jgi:hypothetical protein